TRTIIPERDRDGTRRHSRTLAIPLGCATGAPTVAMLAMRPWVSLSAVLALAAMTAYGVAHWTAFWGLLMVGGAPMTVAAIVIAASHLGMKA
ncbi:hypothetical protein GORBP_040_00010, partial [Gordonia rubripertincta NBRC 101908]